MSAQEYDISVTCTRILSHSDITYLVSPLRTARGGVSYECPDATFMVESRRRFRKTVVYERNIFQKSRFGTSWVLVVMSILALSRRTMACILLHYSLSFVPQERTMTSYSWHNDTSRAIPKFTGGVVISYISTL